MNPLRVMEDSPITNAHCLDDLTIYIIFILLSFNLRILAVKC